MVKSRAEINRDYRKRLKEKDNEGYLRRECERRRKAYTPTPLLSRKEKEDRRKKNREAVQRWRHKNRVQTVNDNNLLQNVEHETSGYDSLSNESVSSPQPFIVALPFTNRAAGPRKRVSTILNEAKTKISKLKFVNNKLLRQLKTEQRRRQRILKRLQKSPCTPKSKAESLMKNAELSISQKHLNRKELIFGNAVADQIQEKVLATNKATVKSVHMLIAGEILRKYRCNVAMCYKAGLNKNTFTKYSMPPTNAREERPSFKRKLEDRILNFMERDDNSRMQPGKGDATKFNGEVRQTRVLTDYLENLHKKFLAENENINVSFATFCRVRLKYIQLSAFITRNSCLCTQHQNMALTTKALRNVGILVSTSPEKFIEEQKDLDFVDIGNRLEDQVRLSQWKRVEIEEKGKRKYVMRIVQNNVTKSDFIAHVTEQTEEFASHVGRVKTQYGQMRDLKQNLPPGHAILHMDFAENYACKSLNEIQSAYWNQTSVTLHPVVVYFKESVNGSLNHKSFVIVSDTLSHNANTVLCVLDTIIPEVKALVPELSVCHYWTDSPTSQYRNRMIFDLVANHTEKYSCKAVWNYFEAGHGKGPCDGLGGTVKRMADTAIKTGKYSIQDSKEFFAWATQSSLKHVTFKYISDEDVVKKVSDMKEIATLLKPIKGTMKIHAVSGFEGSQLFVRDTSCYCDVCITAKEVCPTWRLESTRKPANNRPRLMKEKEPTHAKIQASVGCYVAAIYEEDWFIGKVISIDPDDDELHLTFMEKKKQLFQWPRRPDELWVGRESLLCSILPPIQTGKSKRMFRLTEDDMLKTQACFQKLSKC